MRVLETIRVIRPQSTHTPRLNPYAHWFWYNCDYFLSYQSILLGSNVQCKCSYCVGMRCGCGYFIFLFYNNLLDLKKPFLKFVLYYFWYVIFVSKQGWVKRTGWADWTLRMYGLVMTHGSKNFCGKCCVAKGRILLFILRGYEDLSSSLFSLKTFLLVVKYKGLLIKLSIKFNWLFFCNKIIILSLRDV